ncbi:LysR substrate-binding domain-containing protein [Methylomonas sp. AM2-LC]|uniref:LysR substrate-binding domain-containing protein n=1 Tax=Methylomonas sp. AM2-LC TaxID=3153301 RepID=UPI003265F902
MTALGRLIESSIREIVRKTQAVKSEAVRFSRLNTVPLCIGVMTTIVAHHLSPFFAEFQQERPQIELELVGDSECNRLNQLDEDGLDLVISAPTSLQAGRYQYKVGVRFCAENGHSISIIFRVFSDKKVAICVRSPTAAL